jgi:hypothetical protein
VRYELLVRLSDRSQVFRLVRRTHVALADPSPKPRGTVLVGAIGPSGDPGPARSVRIAAVRTKRH